MAFSTFAPLFDLLPPVPRSSTAFTLDASGEKVAFVFIVPKSGTISKITFCTGTVTDAQTLRVGLETLDASGDPSGSQYGGSAVGTQTSPATNSRHEVTLATPATAVAGDHIAVVIQFDSAVGNLNIFGTIKGLGSATGNSFPYIDHFTTAWAKSNVSVPRVSLYYSSDDSYPFTGCMPAIIYPTPNTYNVDSVSFDELGNLVELPFGHQVWGASFILDLDGAASLVLYDASSFVVRTVALLPAERASTGEALFQVPFASPVDMGPNQAYRLVIQPTTTTNVTFPAITMLTMAHRQAYPLGPYLRSTIRVNAGAWTDSALNLQLIAPIISSLGESRRLILVN